MKASLKVKTIISIAIILIVCLLITSIWQLVIINKKKQMLVSQQTEIERLNNMIEYYQNHQPAGDGNEIIVEG